MNTKLFIVNIVSICCVIAAFILLFNDKHGWGWFLLAGVACLTTFKTSTK